MEVRFALAAMAVVAAFFCACALVQKAVVSLERSKLRAAAGSSSSSAMSYIEHSLRNGFDWLLPLAMRLCKNQRISLLTRALCQMAEVRGLYASQQSVCSVLLAVAGLVAMVATVLFQSPVAGLLAALLLVAMVSLWAQSWVERRNDALRNAVPEALKAMEACSQTGLSLEQMLQQVAKESPQDLGILFQRSFHVLRMGGSSSQALECLRREPNVPELAFVAIALDVQHQTGGSLRRVLSAAREMVEGELSLRRHLQVQTAQARLSARVVTAMPFILAALLSMVSPGFLMPFFSSVTGVATLVFALLMQLIGVLIVRQMLKVDE